MENIVIVYRTAELDYSATLNKISVILDSLKQYV